MFDNFKSGGSKLVYSNWKLVYSNWKLVYCNWKLVYSNWKLVYCNWKLVYSNWKLVYCNWKLVYSNWKLLDSVKQLQVLGLEVGLKLLEVVRQCLTTCSIGVGSWSTVTGSC